ncbi:MAG: hypothetical protein WCT50_01030 [Patescibacteria group bacterium]
MKIQLIAEIITKLFKNSTIFISLLIIFSALIYYFYALNLIGVILSIILSIISLIILNKYRLLSSEEETNVLSLTFPKRVSSQSWIITISYIILLLITESQLIMASSDQAFISPWEMVDKLFFLFYILSSLVLIAAVYQKDLNKTTKLMLIGGHYFVSLSVAVIVYKISYGFDPFIHQAALEVIDKNGFIFPKTPYYLGEYGLIISLHKLLNISIEFLNKFLVPISAALLLPGIIFKFLDLQQIKKDSNYWLSFLETIFILVFSFPLFIISTPQNLSYLFIILAIISGLTDKKPTRAIIFSVATASIHPISGIPAIIWSIWLIVQYYRKRLKVQMKKIISIIIAVSSALFLPLTLLFISGEKINSFHLSFSALSNQIKGISILSLAGSENWLLNLTYLIFWGNKFILIILIITGVILFYKKYQKNLTESQTGIWKGLLVIGTSLIFAFLLSGQISFKQLITYEQADYTNRLIIIIVIFFMPFIGLTIKELIKKIITTEEGVIKFIWLILGIIFLATSLYLAYPRFDRYFNSRGYSTGRLDLEAVQKIDKQTKQNYVVLANQQVSAAALKLLGFNHYYESSYGLIYFYPIPTGGILYQYYLDSVYKTPSRETMLRAMDLAGVDEAYLIINKYWNNSSKIIEAAKLSADSWEMLGKEEIFIFKYKR